VLLFCPGVRVQLFFAHAKINGTYGVVLNPENALETYSGHLGMPIMLGSALVAVFATVTYRTYETGISGQDYVLDVLEQISMWDLLFWVYLLLLHIIAVLVVADPVDAYGLMASSSFMTYFLHRACSPKGPLLSLTQENLNLVGYCFGVLITAYQITDTHANSAAVIMLLVVIDYFLGVGHTYDKQATIDTVANCRLFYVCAGTLSTAFAYAASQGGGTLRPSALLKSQ
jgi:hypothetical protein